MPFYPNGTWYPYQEFINGTIADMGAYGSNITGGFFGVALLFIVYITFLIAGTAIGRKDSVSVNAAAAFVTWAISMLMVGINSPEYGAYLPQEAMYATTFIMVISVAILYFGRSR